MKHIPLTQGYFALVDDDMYDFLTQWKWCYSEGYAVRASGNTSLKMHRVVTNAPANTEVDHKDINPLNNQRRNLRPATTQQNARARGKRSTAKTSRYKGVGFLKNRRTSPWTARITIDYKNIGLGCFRTEIEAAHAYDMAAREYFGEFARTNFD